MIKITRNSIVIVLFLLNSILSNAQLLNPDLQMACNSSSSIVALPGTQSRTNIVFILVDDLGWADLGCYGNRFIETPAIDQLEFNGLTHYQFCHFTNIDRDYPSILTDVIETWKNPDNTFEAPYYPHVSVGWDNNPRFEMFRKGIVTDNTPENFEIALRKDKAYADTHPEQVPLITINSWNEWTETSYLMCPAPCTVKDTGRL